MISIRKYLNEFRTASPVDQEPDPAAALPPLCARLLESVDLHGFDGRQFEDLQERVRVLRPVLEPPVGTEAAFRVDHEVRQALRERQMRVRQLAGAQVTEIQRIVSMMNEALVELAGGSRRSVDRLRQVENLIDSAAAIDDIVRLRSRLSDCVRFVREEVARERDESRRTLDKLGGEFECAKKSLALDNSGLPDHQDAAAYLDERLKGLAPGQAVYLLACGFGRLPTLAARFGKAVAEDLKLRFVRDRLLPLAGAGSVFRWNEHVVVGIFERTANLAAVRRELAERNGAPLVSRVPVGGRVVVLTLNPEWIVLEGTGLPADLLLEDADRFARQFVLSPDEPGASR